MKQSACIASWKYYIPIKHTESLLNKLAALDSISTGLDHIYLKLFKTKE